MIDILKYLILTTHDLFTIFIFISTFLCIINFEGKNKYKIFCYISIFIGVILGFIQFILKLLYARKMNLPMIRMNRYLTVLAGIFILLALIAIIISIIKSNKYTKLFRNLFINLSIIFILGRLFDSIFKYVTEFVYFGEKTISTQSLLRAVGYILGLVLTVLTALAVRRLLTILGYKFSKIFLLIVSLIITILYVATGIVDMGRLKLFGMKSNFTLSVFSTKFFDISIYIFVGIIIFFAIYCIIDNWKLIGEFANKALVRKEKARLRRNRRWATFGIVMCAAVMFTLTYLNYIDTKEVELSPPEEYKEDGDNIIIPLDTVNDGHLHRFSLKGKNGTDIRFLVVKKPQGSAYGLGLDACEICGVAGYYERKDEVVCKRCDVVMNKATIGFKGGCNPIPFEYEIKDGIIVIKKSVLYDKEDVFR